MEPPNVKIDSDKLLQILQEKSKELETMAWKAELQNDSQEHEKFMRWSQGYKFCIKHVEDFLIEENTKDGKTDYNSQG